MIDPSLLSVALFSSSLHLDKKGEIFIASFQLQRRSVFQIAIRAIE